MVAGTSGARAGAVRRERQPLSPRPRRAERGTHEHSGLRSGMAGEPSGDPRTLRIQMPTPIGAAMDLSPQLTGGQTPPPRGEARAGMSWANSARRRPTRRKIRASGSANWAAGNPSGTTNRFRRPGCWMGWPIGWKPVRPSRRDRSNAGETIQRAVLAPRLRDGRAFFNGETGFSPVGRRIAECRRRQYDERFWRPKGAGMGLGQLVANRSPVGGGSQKPGGQRTTNDPDAQVPGWGWDQWLKPVRLVGGGSRMPATDRYDERFLLPAMAAPATGHAGSGQREYRRCEEGAAESDQDR